MQFTYELFVTLCTNKGKTPSGALIDMGISKPTGSKWKKGGSPTDYTLMRMASYFNVDYAALKEGRIEYLEEQKKPTTVESDGLDERISRLVELYSAASEATKIGILAQLEAEAQHLSALDKSKEDQ